MTRKLTLVLLFALVLSTYFLSGIATQVIGGVVEPSDIWLAFAFVAVGTTVVSVLLYLVLSFVMEKLSIIDSPLRIGKPGKSIAILTFVAALVGGVFVSLPKVQEKRAFDARQAAAREANQKMWEAEKQRVLALTPEQREDEKVEREKNAKAAAKVAAEAQEAAKAKKAVEESRQAAEAAARAFAVTGAQSLKRSMKDPDSFELKEVLLMSDGTACYTYRARNSFNAMLQSSAVLFATSNQVEILLEGQHENRFVSVWNKRCAGQAGTDVTTLVKRLMPKG